MTTTVMSEKGSRKRLGLVSGKSVPTFDFASMALTDAGSIPWEREFAFWETQTESHRLHLRSAFKSYYSKSKVQVV